MTVAATAIDIREPSQEEGLRLTKRQEGGSGGAF